MQPGSAAQSAADLVRALHEYGVQSTVITDGPPTPGVQQHRYHPWPLLAGLGRRLHLAKWIRRDRPDIVHAYSVEAAAAAAHVIRPLQHKPKLVVTLAEPPPAGMIRRCDALITTAKHLRNSSPELSGTWVVPFGVDTTRYTPDYRPAPEWVQQHPELQGRFTICLPGPAQASHVLPVLRALIEQGIPLHLLLLGEGSAAMAASLRAAGLAHLTTCLPESTDERDALSAAQAVLLAEPTPTAGRRAALHALALGRPVAGYAHGDTGEYLQAITPAAACPVGSTTALARLLAEWYRNPPAQLPHIPYPYRLTDTAITYYELYNTLLTQA